MTLKKQRPLGETQLSVLDSLKRHDGFWYDGCGWLWDTRSNTIKIMESLLNRGLVTKTKVGNGSYYKDRDKYVLVEK